MQPAVQPLQLTHVAREEDDALEPADTTTAAALPPAAPRPENYSGGVPLQVTDANPEAGGSLPHNLEIKWRQGEEQSCPCPQLWPRVLPT